jgi:hypothetical protein
MTNSLTPSMYAVDIDQDDHQEQMLNSVTPNTVASVHAQDISGMVQKLMIQGQAVLVPSVAGMQRLHHTVQQLTAQVSELRERNVRLREQTVMLNQQIAQLRSEMGNKISYD